MALLSGSLATLAVRSRPTARRLLNSAACAASSTVSSWASACRLCARAGCALDAAPAEVPGFLDEVEEEEAGPGAGAGGATALVVVSADTVGAVEVVAGAVEVVLVMLCCSAQASDSVEPMSSRSRLCAPNTRLRPLRF